MQIIEVLRYILIIAIGGTLANVAGELITERIQTLRFLRRMKNLKELQNSVDNSEEE